MHASLSSLLSDIVLVEKPDIVVYCREKNVLRVLLVLGIKHVWISFEPIGRF
jgi:hypothetical protein